MLGPVLFLLQITDVKIPVNIMMCCFLPMTRKLYFIGTNLEEMLMDNINRDLESRLA